MSEERKGCFFVVFDWMLTDLKLSGYQAFIYAAIYNYSQDPNGCFSGSISYLQKALGASRNAVISALSELVRKGLIAKKETIINGVKFNTYRSTNRDCTSSAETEPPVQKQCKPSAETELGGSAETAPNNKNNKKNNNKGNPLCISPFPAAAEQGGTPPVGNRISPDKPKSNCKTRLPENWFLPKDWGNWALEQGLTESVIRTEAECFADYWRSKGETRADWQATWRNWIRRRRTFERRPLQNGSKKSIYEQNREAGARAKKLIFGDAA